MIQAFLLLYNKGMVNLEGNICYIKSECIIGKEDHPYLKKKLEREIKATLREGCFHFVLGLSSSKDLFIGEAILQAQQKNPEIRLEVFPLIPTSILEHNIRYRDFLKKCDIISYTSSDPQELHAHECQLIVNSTRMIVIYNPMQNVGKTIFSLDYAYMLKKPLFIIDLLRTAK